MAWGNINFPSLTKILPILKGGTGADNVQDAKKNLGILYSETVPTGVPATGEGTICLVRNDNVPLPISGGGTDATTPEEAIDNLGGLPKVNITKLHGEFFKTPTNTDQLFGTITIPANCIASITAVTTWNTAKPVKITIDTEPSHVWAVGGVATDSSSASASLSFTTNEETTVKFMAKFEGSGNKGYIYYSGFYIQL